MHAVDALIPDLLEWMGPAPRAYSEVIDAWRTSCPRLPVWEEACARGFIERRHQAGTEAIVAVSALGRAFLRERDRSARSVSVENAAMFLVGGASELAAPRADDLPN